MTPHDPLRICLVSNTAWSIYNYRHGLLHTLRANGAEVTIIAPRDATFALLEAIGCRCIELTLASKGTDPRQDLRTLLDLWRLYRKIRPHIVFHYTIKPNIYGSLAAALAGVRSVAVTTGLGYVFIRDSTAARVAKKLYRFAFRFPRQVWFLNPDDRAAFLRENLLAHPERAQLMLGEGIDLDYFAPVPRTGAAVADVAVVAQQPTSATGAPDATAQRFVFILIGRLLWDKGVAEYVDAARLLRRRYPHARWQLLGPVGVANPSAITQQEVDAWQADTGIDYLGEATDVRPYIAAADCVVLPSYREGVPRTLLEASAMARPIIATRVPGCIEVVEDGVTGFLCEARSADDLADKMARMLDMPAAARATLGANGRRKAATTFDERVVISRYIETLRALTGFELDSGKLQ